MKKVILPLGSLLVIGMAGVYASRLRIGGQNSSATSEHQTGGAVLQLLNSMNNADVIWSRDYSGVNPIKFTGSTLLLKDVQEDITPLVIDVLLQEDKFVAAHVLLTFRAGTLMPYTAYNWYGLKFQYGAGGITFEGNDLRTLQSYWREKMQP